MQTLQQLQLQILEQQKQIQSMSILQQISRSKSQQHLSQMSNQPVPFRQHFEDSNKFYTYDIHQQNLQTNNCVQSLSNVNLNSSYSAVGERQYKPDSAREIKNIMVIENQFNPKNNKFLIEGSTTTLPTIKQDGLNLQQFTDRTLQNLLLLTNNEEVQSTHRDTNRQMVR